MKYFLPFIFSLLFASLPVRAVQLGQIRLANSLQGTQTLVYEKNQGYALVEGDILLGKIENLNYQQAIITQKLGGTRWPRGIVPFEIAEELPFENKLAIFQAMDHWKKHSKIQFIELNSTNRSSHRDYISFIAMSGLRCSSFVGRQGGKQIISLSPHCTTMKTVHEIGHALGMWHEQSRGDRDYYVRIIWENIKEPFQYNFNQHIRDGEDYGEYDYDSIMHYGSFAFSKNGNPTIVPLAEGIEIGQRNHLSRKDIAAIHAMYP